MMSKLIDLSGKKFGHLLVLGHSHRSVSGVNFWNCVCECGITKAIPGVNIRTGKTKSCGCMTGSFLSATKKTHGMTGTRTYQCWANIIARCTRDSHPSFERYKGRGITVCDSWLKSFDNFLSDMGEMPEGKTIERVDNDDGYFRGNCIWATQKDQSVNRSTNRVISCDGLSMTVVEWAEALKIPSHVMYKRLKYGWTEQEAIKTPYGEGKRYSRKLSVNRHINDILGGMHDDKSDDADKADTDSDKQ